MGEPPPSTDERAPAQHGLDAVVPDRVYEGTPEQVGRAVAGCARATSPSRPSPSPTAATATS
ncbi:MAG: hypothetical protein HS111_28940 [Kofleriaceae bacterium]|nr:hypothetical protein [Kofleriaceae bacterium]